MKNAKIVQGWGWSWVYWQKHNTTSPRRIYTQILSSIKADNVLLSHCKVPTPCEWWNRISRDWNWCLTMLWDFVSRRDVAYPMVLERVSFAGGRSRPAFPTKDTGQRWAAVDSQEVPERYTVRTKCIGGRHLPKEMSNDGIARTRSRTKRNHGFSGLHGLVICVGCSWYALPTKSSGLFFKDAIEWGPWGVIRGKGVWNLILTTSLFLTKGLVTIVHLS